MGECTEVQQKWSTEVLRSVAGDMSLCLGGGSMRDQRTDGPLALTMLSKLVAPWLSDGAQILDKRE